SKGGTSLGKLGKRVKAYARVAAESCRSTEREFSIGAMGSDRCAGESSQAALGGRANRLGQESRLFRRGANSARSRTRSYADRVAIARADEKSDRCGRAARTRRAQHQLGQS